MGGVANLGGGGGIGTLGGQVRDERKKLSGGMRRRRRSKPRSEKGGTNSQMEMRMAKSKRSGKRRKRLRNEMVALRRRTRHQQSCMKQGVRLKQRRRLWRVRRSLGGLGWAAGL